jgi:hypothetical protein|tara:strand:- start:176 stop:517 length:342 start_codon:yes stop_codon:yes gene_type:complete
MANSFINKKADLTTSNLTTLYTVPTARTAVVRSILVSEDAGSGANITVTLVDASSNIFSLFKTKAIASNATTELLTQPLVMEESEILKVQASDANELHVIASILEIQPREVTT